MTKIPLSPLQFDEKLAGLHEQAATFERLASSARDLIHRMAGDKKNYMGRRPAWKQTDSDVLKAVTAMAKGPDQRDLSSGKRPSEAISRLDAIHDRQSELLLSIRTMDAIYREAPWTRYFPCKNADGHIHSSLRGCHTVRWDTEMGWYPSLSGKSVEEAVAELGPTLCSSCFPAAPVEWRQKKSDIDRAARADATAARLEAKLIKNLRETEQFKDHRGYWVETVARCKEVLRDEVELRDYYGQGEHPWHAASITAAGQAKIVLLAREATQAGTGADQAEIGRIIESAIKRNRKNGARI